MTGRRRHRLSGASTRSLVGTRFGTRFGSSLLLPFLAVHLVDEIGLGPAPVGIVVALAVAARHGASAAGVAERLGVRAAAVLGCASWMAATGVLAGSASPGACAVAVVVAGVASALDGPAMHTHLSREPPSRRADAFAALAVAGDVGAVAGPVVGTALLLVDFRLAAAAACTVFAVLTVVAVLVLPGGSRSAPAGVAHGRWRAVAVDRRFVAFALCGAAHLALHVQLLLLLPWEVQRVGGTPVAVGAVSALSASAGVAVVAPLADGWRRRGDVGAGVAIGLTLMAAGCATVAVSGPRLPDGAGVRAVLPLLVGAVSLTAGSALARSCLAELLPVVVTRPLVGTESVVYHLAAALGAVAVSGCVGLLVAASGAASRPGAPALLAAVGLAGACSAAALHRRGLLDGAGPQR